MKTLSKILSLTLLAALVFLPLQSVSAKGALEGQILFGQSFTLNSGQTLDGDLVVFGGNVTIEAGARVNGSVVLFGGTLDIQGEVTGDASIVGGSINLGAQSYIHGDLSTAGATLERIEGSRVDGQITNAATSWDTGAENGTIPLPDPTPSTPVFPSVNLNFQPLAAVANTVGQAVGLGLLAMLLMLFLAQHAERTAHAVLAQPLASGGLGVLTVIVAPIAFVALGLLSVLIITLIVTVPAIIVLTVALAMATLFGWIAFGYEIGKRLTKAMHVEWHPAFTAGLGTFLLSLVANGASLLNFIPGMSFITWILPAAVSLFALGAVIITRFGTQAVQPSIKTPLPPAQEPGIPS